MPLHGGGEGIPMDKRKFSSLGLSASKNDFLLTKMMNKVGEYLKIIDQPWYRSTIHQSHMTSYDLVIHSCWNITPRMILMILHESRNCLSYYSYVSKCRLMTAVFHSWFSNGSQLINQWFTADSLMILWWLTTDSLLIHWPFTNDSPIFGIAPQSQWKQLRVWTSTNHLPRWPWVESL